MGKRLDERRLDRQTLAELRRRAVLQVESGQSPEVVARALGFHRSRIYDWLARYRESGLDALAAKPIPGRPPRLTKQQVGKLQQLLVRTDPQSLTPPSALWTRLMVQALIDREFGVRLSAPSISRLLRKMGLAPQRLLERARQQDPEAMARWKREKHHEMRGQTTRTRATIYFGDHSAWSFDGHPEMGENPINVGPRHPASERFGAGSVVAAVSAQGALRFMLTANAYDADMFIGFCQRLLQDSARPVYLVVDGHPAHQAEEVHDFVLNSAPRLRIFFLSTSARELRVRSWESQLLGGRGWQE